RLSLTASLKSAQLSSNLLLMQSSVKSTATRLVIQSSLQRYNNGNNTPENWVRTLSDLQAVFTVDESSPLLIQTQIYAANSSDYSLVNTTADVLANMPLPYKT